jgi:hypothetical protein
MSNTSYRITSAVTSVIFSKQVSLKIQLRSRFHKVHLYMVYEFTFHSIYSQDLHKWKVPKRGVLVLFWSKMLLIMSQKSQFDGLFRDSSMFYHWNLSPLIHCFVQYVLESWDLRATILLIWSTYPRTIFCSMRWKINNRSLKKKCKFLTDFFPTVLKTI